MESDDGVGESVETGELNDPLIGWRTHALSFEALIGAGAMGAVYLGRQLRLDRRVAIKVIAPQLAANPSYVDRFDREARTLAKLAHPNVVTCHDFGPLTGPDGKPLLIMVMEFVDGKSIGELTRGQAVSARTALDLYRQAADGLAAAHALGIVHRDIKPDNIMVTRSGVAKLADFGLAKSDDGAGLTMAGTIMGTPCYMATEVCEGREPGAASDIYSLGCSLFHTLSGDPPYRTGSSLEVIQQHIRAPIPRLAERAPALAELDSLFTSVLAKNPARRPDASALSIDLARRRDALAPVLTTSIGGLGGTIERADLATMSLDEMAADRLDPDASDPSIIPDAQSARSLKGIGSEPAVAMGSGTSDRPLRDIDLGLSPPRRAPAPLVENAEKKPFELPEYLKPQPDLPTSPPVIAATADPPVTEPAPAAAPSAGDPSPAADAKKAHRTSQNLAGQRDHIHDVANSRRIAEAKEQEALGDAHAAAGRWREAIAAYETAGKSATAEPARRALLAKAAATHARHRTKITVVGCCAAALAVTAAAIWWVSTRPAAESTRGTIAGERPVSTPEAPASVPVAELERIAADPAVDAITVRDQARRLLPQSGSLAPRVQAVLDHVQAEAGRLETDLATIARAEREDPSRALALAHDLRSGTQRLGALAQSLPLPARVSITGPDPATVRLAINGVALPASPALAFCRHADAPTGVVVSAPGYRDASLVVTADAAPGERVSAVTLCEQPTWTLAADARPWIRVAANGENAIVVWPHAALLVAAANGSVTSRVDATRLPIVPRADFAWMPPQDPVGPDLLLSSDDGVAVAIPIGDQTFGSARILYRGAPAYGLAERELVFRVGKRACFAVEQGERAPRLAAHCDGELWSAALVGKLPPWLHLTDDTVTAVDDLTVRTFDQEGNALAQVELGATRTGEVVALAGGDCLIIPTENGARVLRMVKGRYEAMQAPRLATENVRVAAEGDALLVAIGGQIESLRWGANGFSAVWSVTLPKGRTASSLSLTRGVPCVADGSGNVSVLRASDGSIERVLHIPEACVAPALVVGAMVIVADAHGVSGYPLKR